MKTQFEVRKCNINDAKKLKGLERKCFENRFNENFEFVLSSDSYVYFCIESEGHIVAYAGASIQCDESDILYVCTDPAYRKKGLGTQVLSALLTDIKKQVKKVFLEVEDDNTPAIRLYEKLGFSYLSTRKKYYGNKDAIVMIKNFEI